MAIGNIIVHLTVVIVIINIETGLVVVPLILLSLYFVLFHNNKQSYYYTIENEMFDDACSEFVYVACSCNDIF